MMNQTEMAAELCALFLSSRYVLAITGPIGAGKTTVAKLIEDYRFCELPPRRFGDSLSLVLNDLGLPAEQTSMQALSLALRKTYGNDILARGIGQFIEDAAPEITLAVEGVRLNVDVITLEQVCANLERQLLLIYVDLDFEKRRERFNIRRERKGFGEPLDRDAFGRMDRDECETEVPSLRKRADIVLVNDGDEDQLAERLVQALYSHLCAT